MIVQVSDIKNVQQAVWPIERGTNCQWIVNGNMLVIPGLADDFRAEKEQWVMKQIRHEKNLDLKGTYDKR